MARQAPLGDRLSRQADKLEGQSLVTHHRPQDFRRASPILAALAFGFTTLLALCAPAQATNIERVVSPGGIEFWLVRDATVPLVAVNFAFRGGSVQDPEDKGGLAELTV
jgi:hypothetical protein